jgi:hypothetical protein
MIHSVWTIHEAAALVLIFFQNIKNGQAEMDAKL